MSADLLALAVVVASALGFAAAGVLHARSRRLSVEDYISGRYSAGTGVTAATVVASAMGAWVLFSPAEAGTWGGVAALAGYGLGSAAPMLVLIPLGLRMRTLVPAGHSLAEFVWVRYGRGMYAVTVAVMLFYMVVFLTAEMTGIALAVNLVAGTPLALTAAVVGAATVAYTAYGGFASTVFTDRIQAAVILPLLALMFAGAAAAAGGTGAIARIEAEAPALLSFTHRPGVEAGLTFVIAIVAANLFHQGYWQRVYMARDARVLRRAFLIAAAVVVPIVILPGLLGVAAKAAGVTAAPSVAMFGLRLSVTPGWLVLVVMALAVALTMSSMDTLLNGLTAVFTADLARLRPTSGARRLLRWSRLFTLLIAGGAIAVASRGYSVLYLFLLADLVCAAAVVPVFLGLYAARFSGRAAVVCTLAGIAAGAAWFPDPEFSRGHLLTSFVLAAAIPTALGAVLMRLGSPYDLSRLRASIRPIAD